MTVLATQNVSEHMENAHLGHQIRSRRRTLKWSQDKLGKKTNLPQTTIAKIESGRSSLTLARLKVITTALGVGLDFKPMRGE